MSDTQFLQSLRQGVNAAKLGNKLLARLHLSQATETDPGNEIGWLWLAWVAETPENACNFLRKAHECNRDSQLAQIGLAWAEAMAGFAFDSEGRPAFAAMSVVVAAGAQNQVHAETATATLDSVNGAVMEPPPAYAEEEVAEAPPEDAELSQFQEQFDSTAEAAPMREEAPAEPMEAIQEEVIAEPEPVIEAAGMGFTAETFQLPEVDDTPAAEPVMEQTLLDQTLPTMSSEAFGEAIGEPAAAEAFAESTVEEPPAEEAYAEETYVEETYEEVQEVYEEAPAEAEAYEEQPYEGEPGYVEGEVYEEQPQEGAYADEPAYDSSEGTYEEAPQESHAELTPAATAGQSADEGYETAVQEQRTVLVVDDSPTVCKIVALTLQKRGHKVIIASDGVEAMSKIREGHPQLILLDITMPRMDGYQLCKLIKGYPDTKHIPVVMLSGKDGFFDRVRGRLVGCTDYITKPFDPDMLVEKVERYILV